MKTDNSYVASFTILISFIFRPLGSIFFSRIANRRKALRISLICMIVATIGLALTPPYAIIGPTWMLVLKSLQGFALGGSYGASYIDTYEQEESIPFTRRWINYKIAILQVGWILGIAIGKIVVFSLRIIIGNFKEIQILIFNRHYSKILDLDTSVDFLSFGWRLAFLVSAITAILLLAFQKETQAKTTTQGVTVEKASYRIYLMIFLLSCTEFVIFYTNLFVQMQLESAQVKQVYTTSIMCLQEVFTMIGFPIFGLILDRLNHYLKMNANSIVLLLVIIGFLYYGQICFDSKVFGTIIITIVMSACYIALIPTILRCTPKKNRRIIGPILNTGSILGGIIQCAARFYFERIGNLKLFVCIVSVIPLIGIIMSIFATKEHK